jgi:hypothetical protein
MQCLAEPLEPHYGGGVIVNPDFNAGLKGWTVFGYGTVGEASSAATGNRYAVATNRTRPYQSVSQKVYLQNDTHYTLSGLNLIAPTYTSLSSKLVRTVAHGGYVVRNVQLGCRLATGALMS